MRRTAIGTFVALMAGAALVLAQDAPPQGNAPAPSAAQKSSASADKTVTYTGCLESGSAPGTYMLSNAAEVKQPATGGQSAAGGAASSAKSTAGAPSFKLTGTPAGFDLAANLNHKIEVTGMISEASSTPEPRTQPQPNEPRTEPQAQSQSAAKTFSLKTAKSLADRCTE
jgi:hypothetical protein